MREAGYDDVERGERGSSEEHLTVTQFKLAKEQQRLVELDDLAPKLKNTEKLAAQYSDDPEKLLPEVGELESARTYREKKAKPLLAGIV